jgi:hypothetical protein
VVRFQLPNQMSKSVFVQFWNDRLDNEEIVVDLDVTGQVDLVPEGLDEIERSVDEDLTLIHWNWHSKSRSKHEIN